MRKPTDYQPISDDAQAQLFAQCSPRGLVWDAKGSRDSNFYKLIKSLSTEINVLADRIYRMVTQWDVRITDDLILEWETAVGIPDECRGVAEDIAVRRSDVLDKLKKIPTITISDYGTLAENITGIPAAGWNIRPGRVDFPNDLLYNFVLLISAPAVASGAFTYPLGSGTTSVTSLTSVGTVATATIADASTMVSGEIVTISGATQTEYNGDYDIYNVTATTFDYTFAGSATSPATGTISVVFGIDQTQLDLLADNDQYLLDSGTAFSGYPLALTVRTAVLKCVFRKVTPANVVVVFD